MSSTATSETTEILASANDAALISACELAAFQACQTIAPVWPLDQSIAVNPHHQRTGRPVREVAARMAVFAGIRVFAQRSYFRQAWENGRIHIKDLELALARHRCTHRQALSVNACVQGLSVEPALPRLPLLMDLLDDDPKRHARLGWRQAITHQISQTCAAYFDHDQADWQPQREQGLYTFWRETLIRDHGIGVLMGLPDLGRATHSVAPSAQAALTQVVQRIGLPEAVWADYFEAVLLTVNGWASWCAYLGWQAHLRGQTDEHLLQLLAIRLAWGPLLLECKSKDNFAHAFATMRSQWQRASELLEQAENELLIDEVWQTALDIGYQRKLFASLGTNPVQKTTPVNAGQPEFQAVFCIDVRSEPLRRAIESINPNAQTIGFAGFFGLPISYTPAGTTATRPQLPGLFAPSLSVTERVIAPNGSQGSNKSLNQTGLIESRQHQLAIQQPWQSASHWPSAAFSFVETMGLVYVGKLTGWLSPSGSKRSRDDDLAGVPSRYRPVMRPVLTVLDTDTKVAHATRVLQSIGLHELASIVLLVGHEGQSANNAHACALDCGACGGQSGQVNARALASLLNEPAVRTGVRQKGLQIPADTAFVAAVHNTTTDELEFFDVDLLPKSAQLHCERIQKDLALAGSKVRTERAKQLGINTNLSEAGLLQNFRQRASDGAQTRPEWGLSGNAAIVFAPRDITQGLNLEGRTFLHDYNSSTDSDGSLLEALMTGPLLVAYWINWQYHASTCDPEHMGSGNKVLHNVVGGSIGVFEGNGGDLRIGLSRQSLHDGENWRHEPVRLTVVIDAPRQMIQSILDKHQDVSRLLDHNWIHLWQRDTDGSMHQYGPKCSYDETAMSDRARWRPVEM